MYVVPSRASAMRSIEVNEDAGHAFRSVSQHVANTVPEKRPFRLLLASLILGSFIAGMTCGYWSFYFHGHTDAKFHFEDATNVTSELAAGVKLVADWFPANAARIRASQDAIVKHIVSIDDPPQTSPLRTLRLLPRVRESDLDITPSMFVKGLPSLDCVWAVAFFIDDILIFLVGFANFPIPKHEEFSRALQSFIERTYSEAQFQQLVDQVNAFSAAESIRQKAAALLRILKFTVKAGGGWIKFLFQWLAQHVKDPWEVLKKCVTLAAQLDVWLQQSLTAFLGKVALQVLSAKKMIAAGKHATHECFNMSQV